MTESRAGRHPLKLGSQIARKIQLDIIQSGWQPGTIYATEAELIERYGVSRAVLREAISQIESKGIARMRRGNGGGLEIAESAQKAASLALSAYIELANADLKELFEVRRILDVLSAKLASIRITETQASELRGLSTALASKDKDHKDAAYLNLQIRRKIAEASGNPLLALFSDALDHSGSDIIRHRFGELYIFKAYRKKITAIKEALVDSICDGNGMAACNYASRNVDLQLTHFRDILSQTRAEIVSDTPASSSDAPLKLGQYIALKISHDIQANGLGENHHLGSEPELMKRHNVSRAVFREAIRQLEEYSIVVTKRGIGGGLTVGKPDPGNAIDCILTFIETMKLPARYIFEVRRSLEIEAVRIAAERMSSTDNVAILNAINSCKDTRNKQERIAKTIAVNLATSRSCHNRTLELLLHTTLRCIAGFYDTKGFTAAVLDSVQENQSELLDALISRNRGLATRLIMKQHELIDIF